MIVLQTQFPGLQFEFPKDKVQHPLESVVLPKSMIYLNKILNKGILEKVEYFVIDLEPLKEDCDGECNRSVCLDLRGDEPIGIIQGTISNITLEYILDRAN